MNKAGLDLLPSSPSLIPIACYLHRENVESLESLSQDDLLNIKKWLLLVNFNGYYSARTSQRLQRDIDTIYQESPGNPFPYKLLLKNIEKGKKTATALTRDSIAEGKDKDILKRPNKAYLLLLYTALTDNNGNWKGKPIRECVIEELSKAHIFPCAILSKKFLNAGVTDDEDKALAPQGVNGLGNITFMDREENSMLKDELPAKYLGNYSGDLLEQHFIPSEEEYWEIDEFEDFIERRTNIIIDFVKQRYNDLFTE
ncbi:MAG: hypothetical protein QXU87_09885 [Candidatus Caldarchaeum sp.]